MQIKVKDMRMQKVDHRTTHGGELKIKVPVAEAKLVLVEGETSNLDLPIAGEIMVNSKMVKPILISETEKIEVGDSFYVSDLPHDPPSIFKAIKVEEGHSGVHGKVWISDTDYIVLALCKKILALPEHFSPKHLQAIVDGKLKDGDKVLVECEFKTSYYDENGIHCDLKYKNELYYHRIKLNSSNHITLHKLEEKMYNKQEILDLFLKYREQERSEHPTSSKFGVWFEQNVK